jgi:flavin reductase (DIM6/NTAB) family NADH-FMN oxidoreductase RutF
VSPFPQFAAYEADFDGIWARMCINRSASAHTALSRSRAFYINLLAARHEAVACRCSGAAKGEERFESGDFALDESGLPYLADAQAAIRCTRDGMMSYGTHDAVFGLVESVRCLKTITVTLCKRRLHYAGWRYRYYFALIRSARFQPNFVLARGSV